MKTKTLFIAAFIAITSFAAKAQKVTNGDAEMAYQKEKQNSTLSMFMIE
jgi:hypothetical protein